MKLCFKNVAQAGLLSSVIALAACSGDSIARVIGGSDGLVISGQLGGGSSAMSMNKFGYKPMSDMDAFDYSSFAVEFDDLEIVATAQTDPPTTVTAAVDAQGNFSVDLGSDAVGTAVTATFVNENTDAVVGEIKFTDDTKTDLNGNPKADSAVVATGSLDLGAISLSEDGTISVPKTAVASVIENVAVNVATAFDPTGQWAMGAYDKTLPAGFQTVGAIDPQDPGRPHIGFKVTLARFVGKVFTPSGNNCQKNASGTITSCPVTSGTVGTEDSYVLSIWGGDYSESIGACGSTTGFSADEARGYGRTHITTLPTISGSTVAFGGYTFSSGAGGGSAGAPFDQPWMINNPASATAMHTEQDCRPLSISGTTKVFNAWACRVPVMNMGSPTGAKAWQVGLQGGGCVNADTNKPVNVTNWSSMTNCTQQQITSSTEVVGFRKDSCTYVNVDPDGSGPQVSINIKCTHSGGQFNEASGAPNFASPYVPSMGDNLGQAETILNGPNGMTPGSFCATAGTSTPARVLAGYRCYANAYYQNREAISAGGCAREYSFNWNAVKPEDFMRKDDFKGRPQNAFVTNILNYSADGQSGVLEDEEAENVQLQGSSDSNTYCKVIRKTRITIKAINSTKLLFELNETGRMASTEAVCVAAANDAASEDPNSQNRSELSYRLEPQKMIFYINKL